jgi:hypothetical protein
MGTGVQRQGLTFTDGHPLGAVTSKHTTSDWPHAHMRENGVNGVNVSFFRRLQLPLPVRLVLPFASRSPIPVCCLLQIVVMSLQPLVGSYTPLEFYRECWMQVELSACK